ncbi:hypothetical protein SFRURICE_010304 [Spodoptera frugiperda]|nr:hypothetical protein SFRURICE_010304 [Spodoptera frugiperda]
MFWRRIIFCQFPLHKQGTSCKINQLHYRTTVRQWSKTLILRHWISRAVQLHGMHNDQNLTPVDFYIKSLVYTEGIGRVS